MANDYFDSSPLAIPSGTRARASQVNAVSQAVEAGFDKLPTEEELKEGTTRYAVDTGVANAYVVTLPYAITLQDGLNLYWKAVNANTGPSTINVNGTGVKAIRNADGTELLADTFVGNTLAQIIYNATTDAWQLLTNSPEAAQSAIEAANSAAAALVSEQNASTSETNAANSAAAASTSEGNAATSASNALTSEGNAATSETNAATSETNADASFVSLDKKYLGSKTSDPTLDNQGQALADGALYWNTTANAIRVYDLGGTQWVAITDTGNAATLDGLDSTQFLRSDQSDTITGDLTVQDSASATLLTIAADTGFNTQARFQENGVTRAQIIFDTASDELRLRKLDTNGSTEISVIALPNTGGVKLRDDTEVTGSITLTGTVDGRDVAADGTKLDGIESGATADQTDGEIKTAYENNANTNAFTDANQSKLAGIEAGAEVNTVVLGANSFTGLQTITVNSASPALTAVNNGAGDAVLARGLVAAQDGGLAMRLGADNNLTTVSNSTNKTGRISMPHYNTAEQDVAVIMADGVASAQTIRIGGGVSSYNAATAIRFYTAANNTTLTGTLRAEILSNGDFELDGLPLRATGYGTQTTPGAVNNVDFTGIPSWVTEITIMFDGVSGTVAEELWLRIGDSGGFETTGYKSNFNRNITHITNAFQIGLLAGVGFTLYGRVVLTRLDDTSNTWLIGGNVLYDGSLDDAYYPTGRKTLTATLDRLQLLWETGNFDAGTINIRYQ